MGVCGVPSFFLPLPIAVCNGTPKSSTNRGQQLLSSVWSVTITIYERLKHMRIPAGKHTGASTQLILLKEPSWVGWLMSMPRNGPMEGVRDDVERLIGVFDRKPLLKRCQGRGCENMATRCSVYRESLAPS